MIDCGLAIIGGGPAGLAAAIAAYDEGLRDIIVFERDTEPGGILGQCIHNGFGLTTFGEELTGPEYAGRYIAEANKRNIKILTETMVIQLDSDRVITAVSKKDGYMQYKAKAIVLAMGCRERGRGPIKLTGDRGSGVFTAGCAQRYMNIEGYMVGRRAVILGSGDIGLIMARRMTLAGAKVLAVAEIMPHSSGLSRNIAQCLDDFDIPLYLSHTVTDVKGDRRVESVTISQVDEHMKPIKGTEKTYECDTLLLSVGLVPENELSRMAGVPIDPRTNGAVVYQDMQTEYDGIFACGNVLHVHDLVDFVSAESAKAGANAAKYIMNGCKRADKSGALELKNGDGVSYTVPQRVNTQDVAGKLTVFFRVRRKYAAARVEVVSSGERIAAFKRKYLAPGEMQNIVLPEQLLKKASGDITITVVEAEE